MILRYVKVASNGRMKNFFLTGDKGLGKTSLAEFVKDYVETNTGMTGVYISNKDNNTVEGLINLICEAMFSKIPKNSLSGKFKKIFDYTDSLKYPGAKVSFNNKEHFKIKKDLHTNFHFYLKDFINEINHNNGIFLIIDDINGLSESVDFVNWYKKLNDTITVERLELKLYVLFAGYPEKFANLVDLEPSFTRIFHYKEIKELTNEEVKEFFNRSFKKVNIACENEVVDLIVEYSQGLPLIMQNIGNYAFWLADNNTVTWDVAVNSIINTGNELGNNQLITTLRQISSDKYIRILTKLGKYELFKFNKREFKNKLNLG